MLAPETPLSVSILDALDTGVVLLDAERRVIVWNAWLELASGIRASDARGRRLEDIFPKAPLRRVVDAIDAALTSNSPTLITNSLHPELFPLRTRAGRSLIHNVVVGPAGHEGAPCCFVNIVDVTLAVERERVLRGRNNARYDAVVDSAQDVILTLAGDGDVQLANPAASRQFGYSRAEMIGRPASLLFQEPDAWNEVLTAMSEGRSVHQPVQIVGRRKDGTLTHLEASLARWASESRTFVTAILRDVNERRAAEEALRASEAQFRSFAQAAPNHIWTTAPNGEPDWFNDRACEYTGLPPDQLSWRLIVYPDDFDAAAKRWATALSSGERYEIEFRLRRADGVYRWHIARAVPIRSTTGEITRWIGSSTDIEDQKSAATILADMNAVLEQRIAERTSRLMQVEEALQQSQKMEALGQLTGGIAHDFNNLLQGIIGSLERIQKRISEGRIGDTDRFLNGALASANRAAALTHRLLAFSRRQPVNPRPVEIGRLIPTVEELLRRSIGDAITMRVSSQAGLWLVRCDPNQLESALLNLAINARDAMPDGGEFSIESRNIALDSAQALQRDVPAGEYVRINVRDTGIGMPADVKARAFDPFYTTKPIGQGTGLGLSMIYGFVRQSEGSVRIESAVNEGTVIEICLPRFRGDPDAAALPAEEMKTTYVGRDEIVLVVEDESVVRQLIVEVLGDLGYHALEAADGPSALRILQSQQRIDLLVTDIGLPGLNGRQLADAGRVTRPNLRILFMTGYAATAASKGFLDPGMEIIAKPFTMDDLTARMRGMIDGKV